MATDPKKPDGMQASERPIAFTLIDTQNGGKAETLQLFVRPEDLSIANPSRLAITQTFGEDGAWADSFGPGVKTITISGVTGWRGPRGNGGADDGYEHFIKLYQTVFSEWHKQRNKAAKAGGDADKILLVLSDGLDNLSWIVAPQNFILKRNKSRPLMAQYNITLHRLAGEMLEKPPKAPAGDEQKDLALESLGSTLATIDAFVKTINAAISSVIGPIKAAISAFVAMTAQLLRTVVANVRALTGIVTGVVGELIGLAQNIARAGMNIAHTIAAITTLPQQLKASFMQLASAYSNMMCVLSNVFKRRRLLPAYSITGTGNCASTMGGSGVSPYVSENTFAAVLKSDKLGVSITDTGAQAVNAGKFMDPTIANPLDAGRYAGLIASGVVIN